MKPTIKGVTNPQKARIHIAIAELKLSDEQYRDILFVNFKGATSCAGLSYRQAEALIGIFKRLGWKPKRPRREKTPANVTRLASKSQKWKIEELEELLGWDADKERLKGFIRRMTRGKRTHVVQLTSLQAARIIEGLKGILSGGRAQRARGH